MAPANLSETEIRPPALMDRQRVTAVTDVGRMLSRYAEFVHVACPACGADEPSPRFEKNSIVYVDCGGCGTFYVNPRPSPQVLDWFYRDSPNYIFWNEHIFPASEATRRAKIFVPRVDRLLEICHKYDVPTGSLIEVGTGFGTFCSEVISRGVFDRVVGVEPTPSLAATCRDRGIEIIESPVEHIELGQNERFDVAANFEVIEHLFSPREFILHMGRLLRPGGLIVLTCPNGKGFDVETLGTVSNTVDHEHLNYFHPSSLALLLERCGFTTLESFTPGQLDADLVRNRVLSGEYDLSGQPFFQRVLIDEWETSGKAFQEFLIANSMSSNMWLVARKS